MLKRPLEPHCNHSSQTDARSKPHLFSEIATTIRASCFQFCSFTVSTYFIYSIEVIVHWIYVVVLCISMCYCIQSVIHFVPLINPDQWYQSGLLFIYFSSCMSPTRSGYKKLGLEPVEPLQDRSCRA
jgi:hypothetical protein